MRALVIVIESKTKVNQPVHCIFKALFLLLTIVETALTFVLSPSSNNLSCHPGCYEPLSPCPQGLQDTELLSEGDRFGTGSTTSSWDVEQALLKQKGACHVSAAGIYNTQGVVMFTCFLTLFRLSLRLREVHMSNNAFMKYVWFKISLLLVSLTHSCLLYTSPSPRDRQKSRMPSSA